MFSKMSGSAQEQVNQDWEDHQLTHASEMEDVSGGVVVKFEV